MPDSTRTVDFDPGPAWNPEEAVRRARAFRRRMSRRRTVRDYSTQPVPRQVMEECIRTAASAPSGANQQPWTFVVVSDLDLKRKLRRQVEATEREFYETRAGEEWLKALEPLGTDSNKPFIEDAPWLIVVFAQIHGVEDGRKIQHYYVKESVGIATGLLLAALHDAGLATLTHTPAPMAFLREALGRPENEKPFLIVVAGRPADGAQVPDIGRKSLAEVSEWL